MLEALGHDGAQPSQVDVRLKVSGADYFPGLHKTLPTESELEHLPEARRRLREWLGDADLNISSTALVRRASEFWKQEHPERYSGHFLGGHGHLDKGTVKGAFPSLNSWAEKWERTLGRPLSLSAGRRQEAAVHRPADRPADVERRGRPFSHPRSVGRGGPG
ncbi:hypothetical protein [Nocardiopsis ganjiahuensis]|uniref:hypothetical protein n=1 Tax=Nocardiopsis ganjiahuensis TaxID=239984 RepID=UPI00036D4A00|nr:hypothetical protein [Nocardiopsis ganjiahuensis]